MKFALIGHPVEHSFSAQYLNTRFQNEGIDAHYELIDLPDIAEFPTLIQSGKYDGFNVTIPHKKSIIPYLDSLSPEAVAIGAVNVIQIIKSHSGISDIAKRSRISDIPHHSEISDISHHSGISDIAKRSRISDIAQRSRISDISHHSRISDIAKRSRISDIAQRSGISGVHLIGHNTDIIGFHETLTPLLKPYHTHAVILGTGGASQAVQYVLHQLNIPFRLITHKELDANTITQLAPIIINTTPLGMHPNTDTAPNIDYNQLTDKHLIYDLVYNPTETQFLKFAKQQGATTQNGLAMLHCQADAALKIWLK
jgi:shikimate 5-dehydrogenase